jgi:hypothetical protein
MMSSNMTIHQNHTTKSLKNKPVVIGLIYSNSCIHCIHLKPIWKEMKAKIHKKVKAGHYRKPYYLEVEHDNIQKLDEFNKKHFSEMSGEKVMAEGYPTCFKVEAGVIEYYKGNRESNEMENWYMKNSHKVPKKTIKKKVKGGKTMKKKEHKN